MSYIVVYIPIDDIIQDLKKSSVSDEDNEKIVTIAVLIDTVKEKLSEVAGNTIELFVPVDSLMGAKLDSHLTNLANSEITRLLFIYDLQSEEPQIITIEELTKLKTENVTRDDIANENRVIKRLESKGLVKIDRKPANLSENTIQLTEEGTKYLTSFLHQEENLIDLYNKSRSPTIREYLLNFKEKYYN